MSEPRPVIYEVTNTVEGHLVETYERYMTDQHIADLLATGCFRAAELGRSSPGRYRVRYEAAGAAELERYLGEHSARLRADFTAHFPAGVTAEREVWTALRRWETNREVQV
jgi:hypothetical protein